MRNTGLIQAIVFDFDGTLVDTNAIKRSVFYGVTAGISGAADALDRIFEDPNCGDRYDVFATLQAQLGPSAVDTVGLAKAYGEICERRILELLAKSHVAETLDRLNAEGYILFVASATPETDLAAMLSKTPLAARFAAVYGRPTSKADILRRIMKEHDLPLSAVVMIGDGKDDLAAARAAGCRFVGVGTGFAQCRGFDGISLPTLRELPEALVRNFNASRRIGIHSG